MPNPDKSTSDEKLLKIIEGTAAKRAQKVGVKPKVKNPFTLKFKFRPKANLYLLNKSMYIFCAALTLALLYFLIAGTRTINAELFFPASKLGASTSQLIIQEQGGFLSREEYLNEISQKNVFLPPDLRGVSKTGMSQTAAELIADLTLVGIIWSKNPEVMIESQREGRTLLLKKGDFFVQEQIKIKEVTRNSVVLEIKVEGQAVEYELR